jgi:EpsI family protein
MDRTISPPQIPLWRSLLLLVLGCCTILACLITPAPKTGAEPGVNMNLPAAISGYTGHPESISEAERVILPPDTEFARKSYVSPEGDRILCSIVLSGAEKRSIHRPEICLPGQGWTIKSGEVWPIKLPSGRTLQTMKLMLTRPVQASPNVTIPVNSYYIYWFVGRNKTTPHHWQRILWTSWDRIAHGINHRWAYVIVTSLITDNLAPGGKDPAQTLALLESFIQNTVPYFQKDERPRLPQP